MISRNVVIVIDDDKDDFNDAKNLLEKGQMFEVVPEYSTLFNALDDCNSSVRIWDYLPCLLQQYQDRLGLVLCDLRLFNNDDMGLEIIQAIRTDPDFELSDPLVNRYVPIIAYTNYDNMEKTAVESGATMSFPKSRREATLKSTVKSLISYYESVMKGIRESLWPIELSSRIRTLSRVKKTTAFLMTSFSKEHDRIIENVKAVFGKYGIDVRIARSAGGEFDNRLFQNIEVYMHGCKFGIGLYTDDSHLKRSEKIRINPNLSLEVGYMLALKKQICILKERKLPKMNVDLIDRLYCEFDAEDQDSLDRVVKEWLINKGFLNEEPVQ